tara:strand:+ start:135 stop:404 length:270 start_codon:yes stop_codon:yes gene_type:complete
MPKYRTKPIEVEAVQLRWDTWSEMCEHANVGRLEDGKPQGRQDGEAIGLDIPSLKGLIQASEGDWVIKDAQGELDICKPDVFDATYDAV